MARWWWRDGRADARQGLVRITTWTSGDMVAKRQNGDQHLSQLARSDRALAWSRTEARCLVPESRGAILTRESEGALWQTFFTAAPVQRREFDPSSKRRKRRPVVSPVVTA